MTSQRFVRWLAVLAIALTPACQKPREEPAATPGPTPLPATTRAPQTAAPPRSNAEATPAPSAPEPARPSLAQLLAAYVATTEPSARVEVIHQLADAGAPGLTALSQLFQLETDAALKSTVLAVADTFDDAHLEAQLALWRMALGKVQPAEVRETALGILLPVTDRRAIPLWQSLLGDADEPTREIAQEQIELLRELNPQ